MKVIKLAKTIKKIEKERKKKKAEEETQCRVSAYSVGAGDHS